MRNGRRLVAPAADEHSVPTGPFWQRDAERAGLPRAKLVSLLLCLPIVAHLVLMLPSFTHSVWLCKLGEPCDTPTVAPVRLGSNMNFFLTLQSVIPLFLSLIYAAAMRHGSDLVLEHLAAQKASDDDELNFEALQRKARTPSMNEMVVTGLSLLDFGVLNLLYMWIPGDGDGTYLTVPFTSVLHGSVVVTLFAVIFIAPPVIIVLMRNLRVTLIRRKRESAPAYVRDFIWPKLVRAVLLQAGCFCYFLSIALDSPMVARSGIDGDFPPHCPIDYSSSWGLFHIGTLPRAPALNQTYMATFCEQIYSPASDTFMVQCNDGGYDRYTSMYASCKARSVANSLMARAWSGIFVGLAALFVTIAPDYVFGLKYGLTWSNWSTKGTPRIVGAMLSGFLGAIATLPHLAVALGPVSHGAEQPTGRIWLLSTVLYVVGWGSSLLLLMAELGFRKLEKHLRYLEQLKEAEKEAVLERQRQEKQGLCAFWFVRASYILDADGPLPTFKELQRSAPEALESVEIKRDDAFGGQFASGRLLVVSHRWEDAKTPDKEGQQMAQIQEHLRKNRGVELVWYDYWCMPQGTRTAAEKVMFDWMLANVNLLYVGLNVLILLDLSTLSRFWTQFEAWLSMQMATVRGLEPAPEAARRCEIIPIHNANDAIKQQLIEMWSMRTPEEARAVLARPDVQVTTQMDKTIQLRKLTQLNEYVKTHFASTHRHAEASQMQPEPF